MDKQNNIFFSICENSGTLYSIPHDSVIMYKRPLAVSISKINELFVDSENPGRFFFSGDQIAHTFNVRAPIGLAKSSESSYIYVYAIDVQSNDLKSAGIILWALSYAQSMALSDLRREYTILAEVEPILAMNDIMQSPTLSLFDRASSARGPAVRPMPTQILGATPVERLTSLEPTQRLLIAILSISNHVFVNSQTQITKYFRAAQRQRKHNTENAELTRLRSKVGASPRLMQNVLRTAALSPSNWNTSPPTKRWCTRRGNAEPATVSTRRRPTPSTSQDTTTFDNLNEDIVSCIIAQTIRSIMASPVTQQQDYHNLRTVSRQFNLIATTCAETHLRTGIQVVSDFIYIGINQFNDNILTIQRYPWLNFGCSALALISLKNESNKVNAFFKQKQSALVCSRTVLARSGS